VAAHEVVADFQRAGLDEHCRHRSSSPLQVSVDDGADRVAVGIGLQLEDVRRQDDGGEQVVDALPGLGAEVDALVLATVVARHDPLRRELLMHAVRVRPVLVDLVDGDDDRHLGGTRVVYGLNCLRHHAVVGRDYQDDDIRDLGATGTHRGEGFVAGRVDEDHRMAISSLDLVGADPLRDAARLFCRDSRFADRVEDRGLAVVDVTKHRDDGRSDDELGRVFIGEREELQARRRDDVSFAFGRLNGDHVLA